jgi:hypothetical protein
MRRWSRDWTRRESARVALELAHGGTAHLAAADGWAGGQLIDRTTSVRLGLVDLQTGIAFQNRAFFRPG